MKIGLQIFAFIILFVVIYLIVLNGSETVTLQMFAPQYDAVAETTVRSTKTFGIAFYTLMILAAGLFSALCLFIPFYLTQTEQLYAYKRELEKSSVKTDSSASQVKVLQAKVQVLEKALKDALEDKKADW